VVQGADQQVDHELVIETGAQLAPRRGPLEHLHEGGAARGDQVGAQCVGELRVAADLTDEKQVKDRIDKEQYLPLDGMLTQAGDVYLKVHNARDSAPLTLTVPPGTEHSPYWVHLRNWKPKTITATKPRTTAPTEPPPNPLARFCMVSFPNGQKLCLLRNLIASLMGKA